MWSQRQVIHILNCAVKETVDTHTMSRRRPIHHVVTETVDTYTMWSQRQMIHILYCAVKETTHTPCNHTDSWHIHHVVTETSDTHTVLSRRQPIHHVITDSWHIHHVVTETSDILYCAVKGTTHTPCNHRDSWHIHHVVTETSDTHTILRCQGDSWHVHHGVTETSDILYCAVKETTHTPCCHRDKWYTYYTVPSETSDIYIMWSQRQVIHILRCAVKETVDTYTM